MIRAAIGIVSSQQHINSDQCAPCAQGIRTLVTAYALQLWLMNMMQQYVHKAAFSAKFRYILHTMCAQQLMIVQVWQLSRTSVQCAVLLVLCHVVCYNN
jgi:hypothetical protein